MRIAKLAPHGWRDLLLQIGMLLGCYAGYQWVRGLADSSTGEAFWNASRIIALESNLGIFIEPQIQFWVRQQGLLIGAANWMYLNSHYLVSGTVLWWIYYKHRQSFPLVRSSFVVAMLIALVGYALLPTAPPRLMPEWGFSDTVAQATGINGQQQQNSALLNMYAAVPSMHVCFALLIGWWASRLTRQSWIQRIWLAYPLLVMWVVVATANHYLLDVAAGAIVAWLSIRVATLIPGRSTTAPP